MPARRHYYQHYYRCWALQVLGPTGVALQVCLLDDLDNVAASAAASALGDEAAEDVLEAGRDAHTRLVLLGAGG